MRLDRLAGCGTSLPEQHGQAIGVWDSLLEGEPPAPSQTASLLEPGTCVIAPGDQHLAVVRQGGGFRTRLLQTPPVHHCRPAVDVLFRSAAEAAGAGVVATLMTGMGSDGALGLEAIRRAGGMTLVQDEATCVVYGMPRAAVALGVVDRIVPLSGIPAAIVAAVAARPAPATDSVHRSR